MNIFKISILLISIICNSKIIAQRVGGLPPESITKRLLISNGPQGPIQGGESAVTDMVLMPNGWIYGSTKATWGAKNCHIFRTDGDKVEHVFNITSKINGQSSISDIAKGKGNIMFGGTSTYNEIFDQKNNNYEGGHIFSFDPATNKIVDFGIISSGQGINCIAIDTVRAKIYAVTYPAGHLFSYDLTTKTKKDYGEIMTPWRVKDMGRVSWRGVPKVLLIDGDGNVFYSTYFRTEIEMVKREQMVGGNTAYSSMQGGRIYKLAQGAEKPVFTGAIIPAQTGMDSDPLYENGIASAIPAKDGGFWCGTINDGFLFKFEPATAKVINKGKSFQYWNLKSLAYGSDEKLFMLGGRDEDNSWIMSYDAKIGDLQCLGWPENTAQCNVICADKNGKILIAENLRHSFIWVFDPSKMAK